MGTLADLGAEGTLRLALAVVVAAGLAVRHRRRRRPPSGETPGPSRARRAPGPVAVAWAWLIATDDGDPPAPPSAAAVAGLWAAVTVAVGGLLLLAAPRDQRATDLLTAGRRSWDAPLTLRIVDHGYPRGEGLEAVFPGYPLAIRALHGPLGGSARAGAAIALLAGLACPLLLRAWMAGRGIAARAQWTTLLLFLLHPYAYVFAGAVYGDALGLALLLGAVVLAERDRWWLAGLVGALATFTRPNALVLVPTLVVLALERSGALDVAAGWRHARWHLDRLRARHLGALVPLAGVSAYAAWLQATRGDALFFVHVQEQQWNHGSLLHVTTWAKVEFFTTLGTAVHDPIVLAVEVVTALVGLAALVLTPAVARRFGWAAAVLVAGAAILVQTLKTGWAPGGRLLLVAFPLLVLVGERLADRPRARTLAVATAMALTVVGTLGFGSGRAFW